MLTPHRKQAYAMFAIGGLVLVAILAAFAYERGKPKPDQNGCLGSGTRKTVIIIDHTDGVAAQTQEAIVDRAVTFVAEHVHVGELVSLFVVDDASRQSLTNRLSRCKPKSDGNPLIEDPEANKRAARKVFEEPLRGILNAPVGQARESAIAESLIDLSRTRYLRATESARLVLFSDLQQNTKALRIPRCDNAEEGIQQFRDARKGAVERPEFRNVAVYLNIVPRSNLTRANLQCRDRFWQWFFGDNEGPGATLVPDYLPGGSAIP